jgi:hypothetical protein
MARVITAILARGIEDVLGAWRGKRTTRNRSTVIITNSQTAMSKNVYVRKLKTLHADELSDNASFP